MTVEFVDIKVVVCCYCWFRYTNGVPFVPKKRGLLCRPFQFLLTLCTKGKIANDRSGTHRKGQRLVTAMATISQLSLLSMF